MESDRYYEAHITVEESYDFEQFLNICYETGWRGSRFDQDEVDNYHGKWFMSTRSKFLEDIKESIKIAKEELEISGYKVIRWKIEDTILDSELGDEL